MTLAERIARRIGEHGPIPVSEYVDACLYDPDGGFYMRAGGGRAGGRSGHFLTAPEVGPLFGAVLARALDSWWAELGEPELFTVVDWGAGPGTLARSVLAAEPGCMAAGALRLVLVELSPAQRALHPDHPIVTSAAQVSDALPHGVPAGVAVANELLDNLPFDVVGRTCGGWEELRVDVAGPSSPVRCSQALRPASPERGGVEDDAAGCFSLAPRPASPGLVAGLPDVVAAARVPVQRDGAATPDLAHRSSPSDDPAAGLGWLRTHRGHDGGSWWLADPGSCDITADVALDQVQADHRAEVCTQAAFLRAHGIDELVAEGRSAWAERAGIGDLAALRARSRASESEALLDPAGMGDFNVLVWSVG